jgi:hypothetical protein
MAHTHIEAPGEEARQTVRDQFALIKMGTGMTYHRRFPSPEACLQWGRTDPVISQAWQVEGGSIKDRSWNGLGGQSRADLIATSRGENALKAFNAASAKLQADSLRIGGRAIPSLAGGAWVIPQYLASNPMCARSKPRTKLPHKDFRFTLQCSAYVNEAELGSIGATIARSLWDYTLAGGTATLTMFYVYGFSANSPAGAEACCFEVAIPLASSNALALALSPAFYRSILMLGVADGISPVPGDCIPMKRHIKPDNCVPLTGEWKNDRSKLEAIGIHSK